MRTLYCGYEEEFDDNLEAERAKRRARVRREAINLNIFGRRGHYLVVGDLIMGPWSYKLTKGGEWRAVFDGTPVDSPRPKHRKGKRAKILRIRRPMFPR